MERILNDRSIVKFQNSQIKNKTVCFNETAIPSE